MRMKIVLLFTAIFMVLLCCSGQEKSGSRDQDIFMVVLDPAHGGEDTGAVNDSGAAEKDLALLLAECIRNNCSGKGIKVELLRTEDVLMTLDERLKRISELDADLLLSIHTDSSPDKTDRGISMFHRKGDSAGLKFCAGLKSRLANIAAVNDINYGEAGLRLLENSAVPAVVIEFGNIQSSDEMKLVGSDEGRKALGSAVFAAIEEYRGDVAVKKK